ncbi:3-hydroxyacyl-CoA dehydrogenase NAD-binding domain-containing protein [Falsigemmobacter faecalis]|uniref:3-hydroxyacyl-CoA dehydrogenase n=1 Tax=Falsigemmobacter faecalis TaxID=2488730 RepID=A0A3P3DFF5_9RHOB|nr:3-hydroxyacyl-CoA dehydrogenase NAD-binding domain-containing protein [Falsigemmobacter faecalis]RRH73000.1 3-hydroxyacyl-CoA dehydrogenase [Falsigemmobacter faecalis]
MPVSSQIVNDIGVIVFSNPPLNPISATAGIPQGIAAELDALEAQPGVRAIVLAAEGRMFSAGADISEFDRNAAEVGGPIRALIARLDACRLPLVAAIQGSALGGGLEVALGCDYRVAAQDARFALPEVTLGLIPGAGGTQRLPRLTGAVRALEWIAAGSTITAKTAHEAGLADALAEGDLRAAALAFAARVAADGRRRPRDLPLNTEGFDEAVAALRAKPQNPGLRMAVEAAIAAVSAGQGADFDAGLAEEYRIFDALLVSEPARALRYAFGAERAVARVPGLDPALRAAEIRRVAVIGAGTMGIGISLAIVQAGLQARVIDLNPEALERARARSEATILRNRDRGRLSEAAATAQIAALSYSSDFSDVKGHDLIIEAVFEDMGVKEKVFTELDRLADPGTILASNTSTLDVDRIADFTARPEDVVGLHFFSPANLMKLLEVVRGAKTSQQTLATVMGFARQIRKVGVVAGVCDGFIGNRMFEEYLRQAYLLLEEGALPAQVDGAMERWGMAMGPLRTMDLAGQDIGWNIRKRRAAEQPDRPYSRVPDLICEQGWFGQKTGRGYYIYAEPGAKPGVDPEVEAMIVAESARLGLVRRQISDEEIVERCLFALTNEGARLLEEGIAARPLDIDTVWMNGYGFPRFRGGPMFYADRVGLPKVAARMAEFAKGNQGWAWAAAPLITRLNTEGRGFAALNEGAK